MVAYMKIAFIRPSLFGRQSEDAMQPLLFAMIQAMTPKDVEISFFDEMTTKIPGNLEADVVAITVDTFSAKRAYQLAAFFREKGSKIIMGGFHPTMMPEECLQNADAVVIGEAEDTWKEIIEDLKRKDLKDRYFSRNNADLSQGVYDYSVFKGKKYNRLGLVQFSRGCRFNCDFCSIHAFYKDSVRCRDLSEIICEIKQRKEKYLFFIDDNIFADKEKAKELFRALIPLRRKWACQISIDAAGDMETLQLMKKAGCILVLIGFESLNEDNLRAMKKIANINSNYQEIISNLYACGLMIYGTFVIGYDYDTVQSVRDTLQFAIDHNFAVANFNPLMPMPGTSLYERLRSENRLLYDKWWLDERYCYGDAMLAPGGMSKDQLKEACKEARFEFNSYKNILKRLLRGFWVNAGTVENAAIFMSANLISRKEIMAKQGKKLGGVL